MNRYTLSGSVYRQEFIQIIEKMIKVLFGNNNYLHRQFQKFVAPTSIIQSRLVENNVIRNNKIMPKP